MSSIDAAVMFHFYSDGSRPLAKRVDGPKASKTATATDGDTGRAELGLRMMPKSPSTPTQAAILVMASGFAKSPIEVAYTKHAGETAHIQGPPRVLVGSRRLSHSPINADREVVPTFRFGGDKLLNVSKLVEDAAFAQDEPTTGRRCLVPLPSASHVVLGATETHCQSIATTTSKQTTHRSSADLGPGTAFRGCVEQPWHRRYQRRHVRVGRDQSELFNSAHVDHIAIGDDGGVVDSGKPSRRLYGPKFMDSIQLGTAVSGKDRPASQSIQVAWHEIDHRERRHIPAPATNMKVVGTLTEEMLMPEWEGKIGRRNAAAVAAAVSKDIVLDRQDVGISTITETSSLSAALARTSNIVAEPHRTRESVCHLEVDDSSASEEPSLPFPNAQAGIVAIPRGKRLEALPDCTVSPRSVLSQASVASKSTTAETVLLAHDADTRRQLHEHWRSSLANRLRAHERGSELRRELRERSRRASSEATTPRGRRLVAMRTGMHSPLW